jgi:hypothetical protein
MLYTEYINYKYAFYSASNIYFIFPNTGPSDGSPIRYLLMSCLIDYICCPSNIRFLLSMDKMRNLFLLLVVGNCYFFVGSLEKVYNK